MTANIALLGATGALGTVIGKALSDRGTAYRVVGRSLLSLSEWFGEDPLAEPVTWNTDDVASIAKVLEGIETAIYLIGVPYWQFEKHPQIMRVVLEGAERAGVKRILLIGTVYPYGRPAQPKVKEDHPRNPHTKKGRFRKEQEDILLTASEQGKFEVCILRLPDFYGPGVSASFLDGPVQAAAHGGKANMIGPIDRPHEFVYVPDVGPVVARLLETPEAFGHTWHFAGVRPTSQLEVLQILEEIAKHPIPRLVLGKTGLRLLGLFNPMLREMVEMNYLLTDPVLLDDSALEGLIGPIRKTSYEEGLLRCFDYAKSGKPKTQAS